MDDDQEEFLTLLFNLGVLSGSLTKPEMAMKLLNSMLDGKEGERLHSYLAFLHTKLGHLLDAYNMKRFDPKDEVQDGHEPDGQ